MLDILVIRRFQTYAGPLVILRIQTRAALFGNNEDSNICFTVPTPWDFPLLLIDSPAEVVAVCLCDAILRVGAEGGGGYAN